ncbi:MAG: phosphotransferase family protein [Pseudomonadales bacterium]|nr:phosphotransferase family protein [Pseudomonadales bacterium]MCP5185901.1 phosphotransferase family protein [Pseudomonadales bacterium]
MDLDTLSAKLPAFVAAKYGRALPVFDVVKMPGHAGFAYGFRVQNDTMVDSWFIRLPPPNVSWKGTADVLRQVAVLNALDSTSVPHCSVKWSGDDLEWFGCPYFVVPWLDGDVLRLGEGEWGRTLSDSVLLDLGRQVMTALAGVHKVGADKVPYLGEPLPFDDDVTRWDRFIEKAAEPQRLAEAPYVRRKLLENLPADAPVGIFHGDFQTANLFCSKAGRLLAVIDWELCGLGATLNDLGWIVTFSDRQAWPAAAPGQPARPSFLDPDTLIGLYRQAWEGPLPDLNWFRALAAYKFAIISGFNLMLHRRGKRIDETWEQTSLCMEPLMRRASELLG